MRTPVPALIVATLLSMLLVPAAEAEHVPRSEIQWACGFGERNAEGCGIDAVHDPEFGPDWIDPRDDVLGVVLNGDARAYPVRMLDRHEIVNDIIGGVPVAVTWCPLCGSGITFERNAEIDGERRTLDFEVSGYLYKHDLVMWDPQTQKLWTQILGRPIGSLPGSVVETAHPDAELEPVTTAQVTWQEWQERHPGTRLLQPALESTSYRGSAYGDYDSDCRIGVGGGEECEIDGLHPKEEVVGVDVKDRAIAFPVLGVLQSGGVVHHPFNGEDLLVVAGREGTLVFDADGHRFEKRDGAWVDEEGRPWDIEAGRSMTTDETLERLDTLVLFWFAWKEHRPDTALWVPEDFEGKDGEGRFLPAPGTVLSMLLITATALVRARRRS
ncbi:MAG: DUF3179 domain-containing protein [Euryarchaeota archaeon]|nr:DUF3179 domain-containing protein [Euryarchaeota archaeon]